MKRLCQALLLLFVPVILHAQNSIHGTVVDNLSGAPLARASVVVTGTDRGTTTNESGQFTLTSTGVVTSITVQAVGYVAKVVPLANSPDAGRIELVRTATPLPGIEVVATRQEASTGVISKHDIDRFSGVDLADAINTLPGVFMQSRTPFGGAHIDIRGYYPTVGGNSPNSNGLGYNAYINNIPITDASGSTVLDDVDFNSLGSVQVIKGPASSLYGSAIGGTVNMMTARAAPNQTSLGQEYLGGGLGLMRTNTFLKGDNGASNYVLNYGYQADDAFRAHSQSRKYYARGTGDFQIAANQTLGAYFSYNRSYEELAGEIDSSDYASRAPVTDANYLANNSHIQLTSFFTGVSDRRAMGSHFSNTTAVFASGRFANQPFAHGFTDATQFSFGARSAFAYNGHSGKVGIDGTVGGQAERSTVTSNGVFILPFPPFVERPSASENAAINGFAFTEWKFSLPAQVALTVGASLIHNEFTVQNLLKNNQLFDTTVVRTRSFGAAFAPRAEISKGFGSGLIYASISSGYTPPLLGNIVASDGTLNTELKPEHAVQYEVGLQGQVLHKLVGQAALFEIDNTDKLTTQTVNTITSTTNIGKQTNKGVELSASWLLVSDAEKTISLVRPWASYTLTDAKYTDFKSDNNNTATTVDFSGNAVARVPKHRYSLGLDVGTKQGFSINGTYQFVDKVPVTFDNSTWVNSYSLLSAKVAYNAKLHRMWMLNLAAGGDNLGGSTYYTFLFVGPNIKGLAQAQDGGTGDGYILPGNPKARYYFSAGLSYAFK